MGCYLYIMLFRDRRDAVATVDPPDIRGLVTACPWFVAERPRSRVEGQPTGGCLIVSSRVLLTVPFCPGLSCVCLSMLCLRP